MVETLIYESALQEEPEPSPIVETDPIHQFPAEDREQPMWVHYLLKFKWEERNYKWSWQRIVFLENLRIDIENQTVSELPTFYELIPAWFNAVLFKSHFYVIRRTYLTY